MEDIFVTKIVETEKQAEQIVENAKETASKLLEECKFQTSQERRKLEKKYDESLVEKQDAITQEFETEFNKSMSEMKNEVSELKTKSKVNFESALTILLSGESGDGNS